MLFFARKRSSGSVRNRHRLVYLRLLRRAAAAFGGAGALRPRPALITTLVLAGAVVHILIATHITGVWKPILFFTPLRFTRRAAAAGGRAGALRPRPALITTLVLAGAVVLIALGAITS